MPNRGTPVFLGLLALAMAMGQMAQAAEKEDDFTRDGVYLSASGVSAVGTFLNLQEGDQDLKFNTRYSWGANGRVGYRFLEYFAIEGMVEWVDGWKLEQDGSTMLEVENAITGLVNFKGFLPFGRWHPYGEFGLGAIWMTEHDRSNGVEREEVGLAVRPGIGLDVYISEHVGVNAEAAYVFNTGDFEDYSYAAFTWGMFFRF